MAELLDGSLVLDCKNECLNGVNIISCFRSISEPLAVRAINSKIIASPIIENTNGQLVGASTQERRRVLKFTQNNNRIMVSKTVITYNKDLLKHENSL